MCCIFTSGPTYYQSLKAKVKESIMGVAEREHIVQIKTHGQNKNMHRIKAYSQNINTHRTKNCSQNKETAAGVYIGGGGGGGAAVFTPWLQAVVGLRLQCTAALTASRPELCL